MKNSTVEKMLKNGEETNVALELTRRYMAEYMVTHLEAVSSVEKILGFIVEAKKKAEEYINLAILLTVKGDYHSEWDRVRKSAEEADVFMVKAQNMICSLFGTTISIPDGFIQGLEGINLDPERSE